MAAARSAKQIAALRKAQLASAAARKAKAAANPDRRIRATWVMNTGNYTGYTTQGEMDKLLKFGVDIRPAPLVRKTKAKKAK